MNRNELLEAVQNVTEDNFESLALRIFHYQFENNPIYRKYVSLLEERRGTINPSSLAEIPFLPISFFKTNTIKTGDWDAETIYSSSATTGTTSSKHHVRNNQFYLENSLNLFQDVYGNIEDFTVFALLPGYLERAGSSLVSMAQHFIEQSNSKLSGFHLFDEQNLLDQIDLARKTTKKILLLGVSFALWTLAEKNVDLHDVIVMETGGMKGRGPEIPKVAFHDFLKKGLNVSTIHSEYGMTELLSQAYSKGDTIFYPGKTMRLLTTEITDPFSFTEFSKAGIIHLIDLMNIDSSAFIATEDLGILSADGSFQLLGRIDNAEMRGCNLLLSDL